MKQQVLLFFTKLLSRIQQPLLPHVNVHRAVLVSVHFLPGRFPLKKTKILNFLIAKFLCKLSFQWIKNKSRAFKKWLPSDDGVFSFFAKKIEWILKMMFESLCRSRRSDVKICWEALSKILFQKDYYLWSLIPTFWKIYTQKSLSIFHWLDSLMSASISETDPIVRWGESGAHRSGGDSFPVCGLCQSQNWPLPSQLLHRSKYNKSFIHSNMV